MLLPAEAVASAHRRRNFPQKGERSGCFPVLAVGNDIRVWQAQKSGRHGKASIDEGARFFVFDGIRKLYPKLQYLSASQAPNAAGVK